MTANKTLSQVEIIRSLGEALAWFQRELSWGVAPASLPHLTGRIGELYAAMITRGVMALEVNQHGYDVVGRNGERISVKTITTSNQVRVKKSTFHFVDRVLVLRIVFEEEEVSIEEVLDASKDEFLQQCKDSLDAYVLHPSRADKLIRPLEEMTVVAEASVGNKTIQQLENGTIVVRVDGQRQPVAKPILRALCKEYGISLLNSNDNLRNTRQLGAELIETLNELKSKS